MRLKEWILGVSVLALVGCADRTSDVVIESVRQETGRTPEIQRASSSERFGYTRAQQEGPGSSQMPAGGSGMAASSEKPLHWTAPESWVQGPARSMRLVTFFLDDAQSAECYVTLLPGAAGGAAANLNRWRGQMGQAAMDETQLAALPRIACLGQEAPLLLVEGTYTGMGGPARADSLFAGTVVQSEGKTVFVKCVGPKSLVEPQLDAFKAFCKSLHDPSSHAKGASHE